jgi:TonB family protein
VDATQPSAATRPLDAPVGLPPQPDAQATAAPSHGVSPLPPGQSTRDGDGGIAGQAESDAFSSQNPDVVFINGFVRAGNGRVKKSYRVYLNDAAYFALMAMKDPSVVMKARLDPQGKVIDVSVIKSSGSNDVDLPSQLDLRKWEFEPAHDASGQAIADEIVIRFSWR